MRSTYIPTAIRPYAEVKWNYSHFRDREITPEWMRRSRLPQDQAHFYTTEAARFLSDVVGGTFNPIEIEHLLRGYTGYWGQRGLLLFEGREGVDELMTRFAPTSRFINRPHSGSQAVDEFYELSGELDQQAGSGVLDRNGQRLRRQVNRAKDQMSQIRNMERDGQLSEEEADRRLYEIANRFQGREP